MNNTFSERPGSAGHQNAAAAAGRTRRDDILTQLREARGAEPGTDLRGIDLSGEDLAGYTLSRVDLSGANLTGANLSGANLSFAILRGACLFQAILDQAECLGADVSGADCRECCGPALGLGHANLIGSNWFAANLENATLTKAVLKEADFRTAQLKACRLREADLSGADFTGASLQNADLSHSRVARALFNNVDFRDSTLESLKDYHSAGWIHADIRQANFFGAYLLRRHIMDENYLYELRTRDRLHQAIYWIWWITSDCGRSLLRWMTWTAGFILLFAFFYSQTVLDSKHDVTWVTYIYYSVVTMTTLGYGDIVPASPAGQLLASIQVILGYLALGGLLSIFATKMGRRAE